MDKIMELLLAPRPPSPQPSDLPRPEDGVPALEARLARLREREAAADADLVMASATTRGAPEDVERARLHLEAADRLAGIARERERTEEALLSARRPPVEAGWRRGTVGNEKRT